MAKKAAGRPPGAQNRLSMKARQVLMDVFIPEIEDLAENLQELTLRERVEITVRVLPYIVPKLEPIKEKDTGLTIPEPERRLTKKQLLAINDILENGAK